MGQKAKLKQQLQEKANKAARVKDYAKKLLKDCKAWGGPCASCEDLLAVLSSRPDKSELIVKTVMAYYAQTHKQEKVQTPDPFRINKITYEEKLENLMILLSDENQVGTASIANLPSNNDVLKALCTPKDKDPAPSTQVLKVNQLCAVILKGQRQQYNWYLGYIKDIASDTCTIDHLERCTHCSKKFWLHPQVEDIQTAACEQILDIEVQGKWNFSEKRNTKFILDNANEIVMFQKC